MTVYLVPGSERLNAARDVLRELQEALKKQYWYAHPMAEGAEVNCYLCGRKGKEHIDSKNGYLCPVQP